VQVDQNLSALWKVQSKLRARVTSYIKKQATNVITKNSKGRAALVACTVAAWSFVKDAPDGQSEAQLEQLIEDGIAHAAGVTRCNNKINAARGVPHPKVVVLESELVAIDESLERSAVVRQDLAKLLEELGHVIRVK
jgi:hypothetical protein